MSDPLPPVDEDLPKDARHGQDIEPGLEEADDNEVTPNDGAEDTITVMAHLRDKIIPIHCGFGTQQVVWLGHVAIARFDEDGQTQGWLQLGVPVRIIKDGKRELGLTDVICDVLQDRSHVRRNAAKAASEMKRLSTDCLQERAAIYVHRPPRRDELKMCLRAMGFNVAKGEARALVYEFDYTNTETIDLADFQKIFLSKTLTCGKHQQFEDAFRAMDRDEDGKISIRELNDSNTECKIDGEQLRHQIGLQYYDDDKLEVVQDFLDGICSWWTSVIVNARLVLMSSDFHLTIKRWIDAHQTSVQWNGSAHRSQLGGLVLGSLRGTDASATNIIRSHARQIRRVKAVDKLIGGLESR